MEHTIYKYPFKIDDIFDLEVIKGGKILSCQIDIKTGNPCLWILVPLSDTEGNDISNVFEKRRFFVFGTGQIVEDIEKYNYISTIQIGMYVWHIFEI